MKKTKMEEIPATPPFLKKYIKTKEDIYKMAFEMMRKSGIKKEKGTKHGE